MKTKNLAVGALVAVLTLALWWQYLLKPTRAQASKVRAETAIDRSKLPPLQSQLAKARADAANINTLRAQLASLQRAVPDSPALAAFIRDANAIANESGITWNSVTHGPPTGLGALQTISVGIQIKGTYEQVLDYLGRLATLQRLLVVDSVSLSTSANTGVAGAGSAPVGGSTGPFTGSSTLSASITARMFTTAPLVTAAGSVSGSGATGGTATGNTSTLNNS